MSWTNELLSSHAPWMWFLAAFLGGLALNLTPCVYPMIPVTVAFFSGQAPGRIGSTVRLGLPYVLPGVWANRIAKWPKAGPWLVWIKRGLGIVLFGLAFFLIKLLLPFAAPSTSATIRWEAYRPEKLAQAADEGRPAIVDVFADWCLPCVELDHVTFRSPDVAKRVERFAALRVDATRAIPPEAEELLERYDVYGVPAVLLFDADGHEHPELRVQGFVPPKEFLERLDQLNKEVHRP